VQLCNEYALFLPLWSIKYVYFPVSLRIQFLLLCVPVWFFTLIMKLFSFTASFFYEYTHSDMIIYKVGIDFLVEKQSVYIDSGGMADKRCIA
jgi:hypothetical protein